MASENVLKASYGGYRRNTHNPLPYEEWKAQVLNRPVKKSQKKHSRVQRVYNKDKWLETHREYLRWRKTPEYSKWVRKQFLRQGGTCYYCDQPLPGIKQNNDHVVPKILGGSNSRSNLVIACWICNKEKYTKLLSYKERQVLQDKNRKKKGTYHKLKENLKTEEEVAYELRQML